MTYVSDLTNRNYVLSSFLPNITPIKKAAVTVIQRETGGGTFHNAVSKGIPFGTFYNTVPKYVP